MTKRKRDALVEVSYSDSGPGLAGAHPGVVQRSDVIEVRADTEDEAIGLARDKVSMCGTAGGLSARFIRWV